MTMFLLLWLSSMLLCGPTDAASRNRRQQPVNISSSDGTETSSLDRAVVPTGDTTTLRPDKERTCAGAPGLECLHGKPSYCSEDVFEYRFSCVCDPDWTGVFCEEYCNLPCDHGGCELDHVTGQMFCSCRDKYIGRLCDELMPDPAERPRILAAILSSALAVALILIIIIPIIMWRLRVILILKLIYIFKEYEDEDGKEIDAYISMTSTRNTEDFVYGSLQPMLEKHNFKLFLQARDAPPGEVLSETILSALEKSRRTIMIITPDYIRNEWNRFEYLIAQHETLKLRQRIIPIILEDVGKEDVIMDKSLKHILDSVKCLKYPKAKAESILEDIQSPDSNKSVNSTTLFSTNGRSNSAGSVPKVDQKFEKKVAKFWKRLALTMPKKKTENKRRCFLPTLTKADKYEVVAINCGESSTNMDAICKKSGIRGKTKTIAEEIQIQNDRLISTIA